MDVHLLFVDQRLGSKALESLLNVVSLIITCGASKKKKLVTGDSDLTELS